MRCDGTHRNSGDNVMVDIKLIQGDCLEKMKEIPDGSVDLTVTSPPYDNLRSYNGYTFDFEGIAQELYRVTKQGGVVVWVVGDATIKGSETGTSFRQALYFKDVCGFNLHDTMIWRKPNAMPQVARNRYTQSFEYMFVLSKGAPSATHLLREPCKAAGVKRTRTAGNPQSIDRTRTNVTASTKIKQNIMDVPVGGYSFGHPAIFPDQLVADHIVSWSTPGDTVRDPFLGSGTTGKMALLAGRKFIGIEISDEYLDIARKRIEQAHHSKENLIF